MENPCRSHMCLGRLKVQREIEAHVNILYRTVANPFRSNFSEHNIPSAHFYSYPQTENVTISSPRAYGVVEGELIYL